MKKIISISLFFHLFFGTQMQAQDSVYQQALPKIKEIRKLLKGEGAFEASIYRRLRNAMERKKYKLVSNILKHLENMGSDKVDAKIENLRTFLKEQGISQFQEIQAGGDALVAKTPVAIHWSGYQGGNRASIGQIPALLPPTLNPADATASYVAIPVSICTVDAATGALAIEGVGNCKITLTATPADSSTHSVAKASLIVTINPGVQTVSAAGAYGSGDLVLIPGKSLLLQNAPTGGVTTLEYQSASSGICTVEPASGEVTADAAGNCLVQARWVASSDYSASAWTEIASINVIAVAQGTVPSNAYKFMSLEELRAKYRQAHNNRQWRERNAWSGQIVKKHNYIEARESRAYAKKAFQLYAVSNPDIPEIPDPIVEDGYIPIPLAKHVDPSVRQDSHYAQYGLIYYLWDKSLRQSRSGGLRFYEAVSSQNAQGDWVFSKGLRYDHRLEANYYPVVRNSAGGFSIRFQLRLGSRIDNVGDDYLLYQYDSNGRFISKSVGKDTRQSQSAPDTVSDPYGANPDLSTPGTLALINPPSGGGGQGTLQYDSLLGHTCSVDAATGEITKIQAGGTCAIIVRWSGDRDHYKASDWFEIFRVTLESNTQSAPDTVLNPYGANPDLSLLDSRLPLINPPSGGDGHGRLEYDSLDWDVCSVHPFSGEMVKRQMGTCEIRVRWSGDRVHAASAWFVIFSGVLTGVELEAPHTVIYPPYGDNPDLSASGTLTLQYPPEGGGGQGGLEYDSLDPAVCTVNSATGEIGKLKAGTCEIRARWAGDGVYYAPSDWFVFFSESLR